MYFQALREFGTQKKSIQTDWLYVKFKHKSSNRNVTGARDGNRTRILGLGSPHSTTELHMHNKIIS